MNTKRLIAIMLIAVLALTLFGCKRKDVETGVPDEDAVWPAGYVPADGEDDVSSETDAPAAPAPSTDGKTETDTAQKPAAQKPAGGSAQPKPTDTSKPAGESAAAEIAEIQTPEGTGQAMSKAEDYAAARREFAYLLLRGCYKKGSNTLVSPLSVQTAIALLANGAEGETLDEIRNAALGGLDVSVVNDAVKSFEDDGTLKSANSVWLNADNGFKLTDGYDRICRDYYKAEPAAEPFNTATLGKINGWVKEKTDGMIDGILDELTPDMQAILINALAFDAEWEEKYTDVSVSEGEFTNSDGGKAKVDYMHGTEYSYIDDGKATGFTKRYKGGKYAFAALLPNEGVSIEDYVAGLDGSTLEKVSSEKVITKLPKFKIDYFAELRRVLMSFGMVRVFTNKAELSKLGADSAGNPVYVSNVLHKTHIDVYEGGTRAAAVTAIITKSNSAMPMEEPKRVELTRPFVYMIIDTETNAPLFIGVADMLG